LRARLARPEERTGPARYDEVVGWLSPLVEPGTYAHADEASVGERRPVLLYGDSFAACVPGTELCWQDLLERSELGETHRLLNYGVGGYGLDQIYLLFERSIDRYVDRDPIVILGILVDDDLDRSVLGFRQWPKARVHWEPDVGLRVEAPATRSVQGYLDAHPLPTTSWGFRYLIYGADVLPRKESEWVLGRTDHVARTRDLNRHLLEAVHEVIEARRLDAFVLLFHGEHHVEWAGWREGFVTEELERLQLAYVGARPRILAHHRSSGVAFDAYFISSGHGEGHYTSLGNETVFAALLEGLVGDVDGPVPTDETDSDPY
jgi:hypothetical protein